MLGDKVNANDAEKMGMIYKVFSVDSFEEEYLKMSITLAQMPTKALGLTKQLLNESMDNSLDEQLQRESDFQIEASQSADYQEGVQAFIEKRKPEFKGN